MYEIKGRVVDSFTGDGLGGVRVEAWDKDYRLDDFVGSAATVSDGSFSIRFDPRLFAEWFDVWPDLYFRVYCHRELLASTEDDVLWNVRQPHIGLTIQARHPEPADCGERHIYLKIERIEDYSPVNPDLGKVIPPAKYGRDCMRGHGHEDATIPQAEIEARALTAVTYREYLDSGYLIPKPDPLIAADVNEPGYTRRVPGTVIYTRPCQRLKIHVWNADEVPHSLHVHGLRYGIDSDGSWPFGTEAAHHGGRSDAICPGDSWTYTYDVPDDAIGAWPFHDHTHHHFTRLDQGLFGGIVVLGPCDRPPRSIVFPWHLLEPVFLDVARHEGRPVLRGEPSGDDAKESPHEHGGRDHHDHEPPAVQLQPGVHARHLKPDTQLLLDQHRDLLEEFARANLKRPRFVNTDHVPVFFHAMVDHDQRALFDIPDIEELGGQGELDFHTAGDFPYFCRHHPDMSGTVHVVAGGPALAMVTITGGPDMDFSPADVTVGVGGTVRWVNDSAFHHTVTSREGAALTTHCINGRGFVGNSPTIVGAGGQRIRFYVFNLDTSPSWHNFHLHAMRWRFGGESVDVRSMGPAESFVVETTIPPVLLLTEEEERAQDPEHRPEGATLRRLKGDFVFHCHVHHHMMNGMVGLVRARQSLWLTDEMAHEISHRTGLPLDDGSNACPDVDPHPCHAHGEGRWEIVPGTPDVMFMHSLLLPNTQRVLFWGRTFEDQSQVWDYSTPAGSYLSPANQPADSPGLDENSSDMWSAEHTFLDDAAGTALIHGGFAWRVSFTFDPGSLTWTRVDDTTDSRFYATTLTLGDGRAATLFGSASPKSIEIYTPGTGWGAPIPTPPGMAVHQYYPFTYLLPDGRLFIAGPHDPAHRFDVAAPAGAEPFPRLLGNRSSGGEKSSSVMLILRPPDYKPIVYIMGGDSAATEQTAEMIDLSAAAPAWVQLPDLAHERSEQFTATLLPDGRVFLAGGITGANGGPCEIFDPRNPAAGWQLGPTMTHVRTYHSSFLLLPDGSVLGGGAPPDAYPAPGVYTPHERFYPGYFDALRPVISGAPASIGYGGTFSISTPDPAAVTEVVLLRPGSVTHGFNMSQRGIELVIDSAGAGTVDVQEPPHANLAPPGWHLLFILNASRTPSVGHWIRLTP